MKRTCLKTLFFMCCPLGASGVETASSGITILHTDSTIKAACEHQVNDYLRVTGTHESTYPAISKHLDLCLQNFGYFSSEASLQADDHGQLLADVTLGPQTLVEDIIVTFSNPRPDLDPKLGPVISHMTAVLLHRPFNSHDYQNMKSTILKELRNRGYLDAVYTEKQVEIDREHHQAHITLTLHLGKCYYVGDISYSNPYFAASLLNSYAGFSAYTPFSEDAVNRFESNLAQTGYFRSVNVDFDSKKVQGDTIPLHVDLMLDKSFNYQVGAGYDSVNYWQTLFNIQWSRINHWGHKGSLYSKISVNDQLVGFDYVIPGNRPIENTYVLSTLYDTNIASKQGDYQIKEFTFSRKTALTNAVLTASASQLYEHDYPTEDLPYNSEFPFVKLDLIHFLPAFSASSLSQGYVDTYMLGYHHSFGSVNEDVLQWLIDGYYSFYLTDQWILRLHDSFGVTFVDDLQALPLSLQFAIGGPNSLRAYAKNAIGTGKQYALISQELLYAITPNWLMGPFYDRGTVADHIGSMYSSAGVVMSYHSALGDINLSVGRPLDYGHGIVRFQLSFTPIFKDLKP